MARTTSWIDKEEIASMAGRFCWKKTSCTFTNDRGMYDKFLPPKRRKQQTRGLLSPFNNELVNDSFLNFRSNKLGMFFCHAFFRFPAIYKKHYVSIAIKNTHMDSPTRILTSKSTKKRNSPQNHVYKYVENMITPRKLCPNPKTVTSIVCWTNTPLVHNQDLCVRCTLSNCRKKKKTPHVGHPPHCVRRPGAQSYKWERAWLTVTAITKVTS